MYYSLFPTIGQKDDGCDLAECHYRDDDDDDSLRWLDQIGSGLAFCLCPPGFVDWSHDNNDDKEDGAALGDPAIMNWVLADQR